MQLLRPEDIHFANAMTTNYNFYSAKDCTGEASEESETKTEEAEKQLALSAVEKPKEEASPEKEPSEEGTPTDSESPGEFSEEQ